MIRNYFNRLSYSEFLVFLQSGTHSLHTRRVIATVRVEPTNVTVCSQSPENPFFFSLMLKSHGQTTAYLQTDQTSGHTMAEQKLRRQYSMMSQVWCWNDCGRIETNSPSGHLRSRWNIVIERHSHSLFHPSLLSHTLRRKPHQHVPQIIFTWLYLSLIAFGTQNVYPLPRIPFVVLKPLQYRCKWVE